MIITAAILSTTIFLEGALSQITTQKLFLLEDPEHHQWCAYGNEPAWASEVKSLAAEVVGTVEFSKGKISRINVTEEDETGDWIAYDPYTIASVDVCVAGGFRAFRVMRDARVQEYALEAGDRSCDESPFSLPGFASPLLHEALRASSVQGRPYLVRWFVTVCG